MNADGASGALRAAAEGDDRKLDELAAWLLTQDGVEGRYLADDLRSAASDAAVAEGDGGLERLLDDLRTTLDSTLVAFFPEVTATAIYEFPGAAVGPAGDLADRAPWPAAREI